MNILEKTKEAVEVGQRQIDSIGKEGKPEEKVRRAGDTGKIAFMCAQAFLSNNVVF